MFKQAIETLLAGQNVSIRPKGNSMKGKINSGQLVTLAPIGEHDELLVGEIVLVKVHGNVYLHLISAINGTEYQIANNKGFINGWTNRTKIFGKVIRIED